VGEEQTFILPGGKVDADALREAAQQAADDGGPLPTVRFEISRPDLKTRLDRYLTSRITFLSRNQLQRLIESGAATVNEQAAKASTKIKAGDVIALVIPPPPSTEIQPEEIPIDVLFEDEHLIVLNKRPDIIVHPARSELKGTLVNALAWHFQHSGGELSSVGGEFARPGVVHRLDRHTSGCIVFAKTDEAHWKIARQFEHRTADKRYLAVVEGSPVRDMDVIDLPIGPHPSRTKGYREKQVVRHDDLGKPSVTICRVRERYGASGEGGDTRDATHALLELELKTGRTHQIRVHLSHLGMPIVGDDMYGGHPFEHERERIMERQALHAGLLAFEHPVTGQDLVFTASPPKDFAELVRTLRRGAVRCVHLEGTVPLSRLGLSSDEPGIE